MRWPWSRGGPAREKRDSGGDFSDAVVRLIEAQAAGTAADASSTAAVEAASGSLARAFAAAAVEGPAYAAGAVTPAFLAQVGRDLVRSGDSMHVIRVDRMGRVGLIPASSWHFEGSHDPDSWTVRATAYGPSTSTTWKSPGRWRRLRAWGSSPGQPYVGTGPLSWAHTTARLGSETERSLADEAGGPLAQLLAIPADGGDDGDDDPLKALKTDIRTARGKALLLETSAAGWGEGKDAAPKRDWTSSRLGPVPPEALVRSGATRSPARWPRAARPWRCFPTRTGPRSVRPSGAGTSGPCSRSPGSLEHELSEKLEADIRLRFDAYPLDLAGRAQAFQKLVAGGVSVTEALATSGLLAD